MPDILSPSLSTPNVELPNIPVQVQYPDWKSPSINKSGILDNAKANISAYPSDVVPLDAFSAIIKDQLTPEQIKQQNRNNALFNSAAPSLKYKDEGFKQRSFLSSDAIRYKQNNRLWNSVGFNPDLPGDIMDAMYDHKETSWESFKNIFPKMWSTASFQFKNYFAEYADAAQAIGTLDASVLYNQDRFRNYSQQMKNLEDLYPDYRSDKESKWYQLWRGDFWEESGSSIGFTLGTIGAALLENVAVTGATAGLGEVAELINTPRKAFKAISEYYSLKRAYGLAKGVMGAKTIGGGLSAAANIWRLANGALSEATFEGFTAREDFVNGFIEDYIQQHGEKPSADIIEKVNKAGDEIAKSTILFQTPFLMASNAAQFGNVIAPKGFPKLMKAIGLNKDKFSFFVDDAFKVAVKETAEKAVNPFYKFAVNPFKNSIWEGTEESYQALVSKATADYYNDKYFNADDKSVWKSLGAGFEYVTSNTGMKEFMAGFATGAIFQHAGKPLHFLAKPKTVTNDKGETEIKENFFNKTLGLGMKQASEIKERQKYYKIAEALNATSIEQVLKEEGFLNMIKDKKTALALAYAIDNNDFFNVKNLKQIQLNRLLYSGLVTGKIDLQIEKLKAFASQDFKTVKDFFDLDENQYSTQEEQESFMSSFRAFTDSLSKKSKEFERIFETEKIKRQVSIQGAANKFDSIRKRFNNFQQSLIEKYNVGSIEELNQLKKDGKMSPEDVIAHNNNQADLNYQAIRYHAVNEGVKASVFAQAGMMDDAREADELVKELNAGDNVGIKYNFELGKLFQKGYRDERKKQLQSVYDTVSDEDKQNKKDQLDAFNAISDYLDEQFEDVNAYSIAYDNKLTDLIQDYFYTTQIGYNKPDNNISVAQRAEDEREKQRPILRNFISLQRRNQENLNLLNYLAEENNFRKYLDSQSDAIFQLFDMAVNEAKKETKDEAAPITATNETAVQPVAPVAPDVNKSQERVLLDQIVNVLQRNPINNAQALYKLIKDDLDEADFDLTQFLELLDIYIDNEDLVDIKDELMKFRTLVKEANQDNTNTTNENVEQSNEDKSENFTENGADFFSSINKEAQDISEEDSLNNLKNNSCKS